MANPATSPGIRPIATVAADRLLATPGRAPARRNAQLEIADGAITAVTNTDTLAADVGGPGTLVLPGLTNAHDHGRGLKRLAYGATDAALEIWLPQLGVTHPAVDPYTIHAVAFAPMARSGITSVVHCHVPQRWDRIVEEAEQTCRAAADVGIRLAFVVPLRDINMLGYGDPERILGVDAAYQRDYVAWLDHIGFLSERLTLAHGVWLRPAECERLADRGVTVSVNTSSNLRLRSGLAPVAEFVRQAVPIAICLDGSALDDDDDMLREMRLTYLLHAGTALDEVLTPARIVTAAAAQGAWAATGRRGSGELAPGHPADLLRDSLTGELDLTLGRATQAHVTSVVAHGHPTGVDLDALSTELVAQADRRKDGDPAAG